MHHSFIHDNIRVDVELRESSGAWAWTCVFSDGLISSLSSKTTVNSVSQGLQLACQAARQTIEKHNRETQSNMTDNYLSLHVEATSTGIQKYFWVITERPTPDHLVEVAASLDLFNKPSDAYRAGESVLQGMAVGKAPQAGQARSVYSPASSSGNGSMWATLH